MVTGAYGLRLGNLDGVDHLLVAAEGDWPLVRIEQRSGSSAARQDLLSDTAATLTLHNGGEIRIDREQGRATFVLPEPVQPDELVHPLLAPVGAVMAHWLDRQSFHAAAVAVDGRVWGILGERGSGKSTTATWLALQGFGLICDDLLVLEAGRALAGPRSADLRREAAERLDAGEPLGIVGARERWRVRLDPVESGLEVAGWIFLAWGEQLEAVPLSAAERLLRLHVNRGVTVPPRDPVPLLDLAALPAWELLRTKGWSSFPGAAELLLATIA